MSGLTDAERRRRQRALRKAQDKVWAETMGPAPDHVLMLPVGNVNLIIKKGIDVAPLHMIDMDALVIDKAKCRELTQSASDARPEKRADRMADIRWELPEFWGVRGKAKEVAEEYFVRTGDRLTVRTIQKYFRLSRP